MREINTNNEGIRLFDIVIAILTIYVLIALVIESCMKLPKDVQVLLQIIDTGICFIFLGDFFYRFYRAKNRVDFMKWGWIDFISSLPTFQWANWFNAEYIRLGRLVRLVRVLRLLKGIKAAKSLSEAFTKNKASSAMLIAATLALSIIIFSSIAILYVEQTQQSQIKDAGDALWWAVVTVTTVGYGDMVPVTFEGRVIAILLMITGLGLFGTFTGFISSLFLGDEIEEVSEDLEEAEKEDDKRDAEILARLDKIEKTLESLSNNVAAN